MRQREEGRERPREVEARDELRLESGTRYDVSTHVLMSALLFAAIGFFFWKFPGPWTFDMGSRDFNPMIGVPAFLGAMGLWEAARATIDARRLRKFGRSTLAVRGKSIRLGRTFEGVVRTPRSLKPSGPFEILVQCVESVPHRDIEVKPGGPRYVDHVRWEQKRSFTLPADETDVAVSVQLPHVSPSHGKGATRWILAVTAPCEGVDYEAVFLLPVQAAATD